VKCDAGSRPSAISRSTSASTAAALTAMSMSAASPGTSAVANATAERVEQHPCRSHQSSADDCTPRTARQTMLASHANARRHTPRRSPLILSQHQSTRNAAMNQARVSTSRCAVRALYRNTASRQSRSGRHSRSWMDWRRRDRGSSDTPPRCSVLVIDNTYDERQARLRARQTYR
jgi:hypothetical protein